MLDVPFMLTFLIGGARSGKSALALELATDHAGAVTYIATSPRIEGDADLDHRIDAHRAERPAAWTTIEEPHDLGAAFALAADSFVIVDCITLWVSNLLWRGDDDDVIVAAAREAATVAAARAAPTVVISNEVGLGVHPETDVGQAVPRPARTGQPDLGGRRRPVPAARRRSRTPAPRPPDGARVSSPTTGNGGRTSWLHDALGDLPRPDAAAGAAVHERAANILRPSGALRWLDEIAEWVAGWHRNPLPQVTRPAGLIFAADHGIAAATEVSAYPTGITEAMLAAFREGRSTISAFARHAGATVEAIDVGVGKPTADIRYEAALSPERFDEVVAVAVAAVDALDTDLLVLGEMGIGNTTPSAAVAAALAGGETAAWVGRGTGIDDEALARKRVAVQEAVRRIAGITDPLEVLREVGGAELVAIAAATVAARLRSIPIVLDGYVVTTAVLPLSFVNPEALDHCTVGHCSAEPGHRKLLERLGKRPLLDLDMRLGEGSGAMAAVPLVAMACAGITEVPTFGEWFGE